ncbi:MAG: riboflavin synthase [Desulfonatronovibrionaceae bacterium]
MFTGLVQGTGKINRFERQGNEAWLGVTPEFAFPAPVQGESVAVNGACLTLETCTRELVMYASGETLGLTNLGGLSPGDSVNLERALALGDRLGGHLVSGHVDCLAVVRDLRAAGQSRIYHLEFPEKYSGQVISKGSVALDGISLTVNSCGPGFLEVNIIPETQKATTVSFWKSGTRVNMETDMIGKYVQSLLYPWDPGKKTQTTSDISLDFLREHGF